ncbi:MAG: ABC transporter ATP-binding protein [Chitinophagaceae bacterium]
MMILMTDAGKRFNREWIFRHFNYEFLKGRHYAITGPNGSGKSTLLQVIAGAITPSEGSMQYHIEKTSIDPEKQFSKLSFCAPYLELIEEMTAVEFLSFHQQFKSFLPGITQEMILDETGLSKAAHKQIRYYSSGMKQRMKLAQAIFTDTPILLLDEPCTNLDKSGVALYRKFMQTHARDRLVVISSNDEAEYDFCDTILSESNWKNPQQVQS